MDAAEVDRRYTERERESRSYASVTYMNASAPLGRILLIRKGKDVCGVRFTEFHRGRDAKPPTIFHSGEETQYAEYDWYYQGDGSGDFKKPDVKAGHEVLVKKPLVGVGRLAFQTGNIRIRCGPFVLGWIYPNHVAFSGGSQGRDEGIELSPTNWRDTSEVNLQDQRIRWYVYDEKRQDTLIPVEEIW